MNKILETATKLQGAGISVVPVARGMKAPSVTSGVEMSWKEYQTRLPTTDELRAWFASGERGLGVVGGAVSGNLVTIDFDVPRFYDAWRERVGALADGLLVEETGAEKEDGRPGYHVAVRSTEPVGGNEKLAYVPDESEDTGRRAAIETRGEGGQAIASPSRHAVTGKLYRLVAGDWANVPVRPAAIVATLLDAARALDEAPLTRQQMQAAERRAQASAAARSSLNGNGSVIEVYNSVVPIIEALEQHGYTRAGARYKRPGGKSASVTILDGGRSYHHSSNDPLSDGYSHDAFDVFVALDHGGDIHAAASAAARMPEVAARLPARETRKPAAAATASETPQAGTPAATKEKPKGPTHDELAARWLDLAGVVAYGLGEWRQYDPVTGTWPARHEDAVKHDVLGVIEAAKPEGIRPTRSIVESVAELARLKVRVLDECFDADADVLVCKNGVLHIPTRTLREHSPDGYATFALPYAYEPQAEASVWKYFLESTLDREVADLLQEYFGYALTTDCSLETAIWLYGVAGSGKSTAVEGAVAMLGERAGTLSLADIEKSRFGLAGVVGKTLLVATESPSGLMAATDKVNRLISGETIRVEQKYRDAVDVRSRAKILWAMNEWPRVASPEDGLFRRVLPIKFTPRAEADRDPEVKEQIATEGAGLLNWALDGLARLRARKRFAIPAAVRECRDEFQHANDIPAMFVAEACELAADARVQSAELYEAYKTWCEATGHKHQSSTTLAADWQRLGFERRKYAGLMFWYGLRLAGKSLNG